MCGFVCLCLYIAVCEGIHLKEHKNIQVPQHLFTLWTFLNRTMRVWRICRRRSSAYKRMDTIKQWDQTNRFVCVCEPRDRHKRHRQWKRGEMKRRKACFSGSELWANYSFLTRRQEGKDVTLFSVQIFHTVHLTLHMYCMMLTQVTWWNILHLYYSCYKSLFSSSTDSPINYISPHY